MGTKSAIGRTHVHCAIIVVLSISVCASQGFVFEEGGAANGQGCHLPQSSTQYTLLSSELDAEPGQLVPPNTVIRQPCEEGHGDNGFRNATCVNGRWSVSEPQCKKMCAPLFKRYVRASCTYQGVAVQCSEQALDGTVASCAERDGTSGENGNGATAVCEDGAWSQTGLECRGACGLGRPDSSRPDGVRFPWHVAIYRSTTRSKRYICGGSIVSPKVVLTAAHCIEYPKKPEWYSVGAGKSSYKPDETKHSQYRAVEATVVSPFYGGVDSLYSADVALIVVAEPFVMNRHVAPVCLPPNERSADGPRNYLGTVPNWSQSDIADDLNEELHYSRFPTIDFRRCLDSMPTEFQKYLSYDKLCAGFRNGTGLCFGAGGGGFVSQDTSATPATYTIRGIVSVALRKSIGCDHSVYSVFTDVQKHLPWLYKEIQKYE